MFGGRDGNPEARRLAYHEACYRQSRGSGAAGGGDAGDTEGEGMMQKKRRKQQASQGLGETDTAYQMGLNCPIGQEISLISGLVDWWPDLSSRPQAKEALLEGLATRFGTGQER